MLRAIGFFIKLGLFALLVLILGNWFHWRGKTISDQIKTQMSHAERSGLTNGLRNWGNWAGQNSQKPKAEDIRPSERQKLRALIRELNSSQKKD